MLAGLRAARAKVKKIVHDGTIRLAVPADMLLVLLPPMDDEIWPE